MCNPDPEHGSEFLDIYAMASLPPAQFVLLKFIEQVSSLLGRKRVGLRICDFVEGITSDGCRVFGVTLSDKTIRTAYFALENVGILRRTQSKNAYGHVVNRFEIDFKTLKEYAMGKLNLPKSYGQPVETEAHSILKTPKRERKLRVEITEGTAKTLKKPSVKITDYRKHINNKDISKDISPRADTRTREDLKSKSKAPSAIEQVSSTLAAITQQKREKARHHADAVRSQIASHKKLTHRGFTTLWREVMNKHYPTIAPDIVTAIDFGKMKSRLAVLVQTGEVSSFLDFVVKNWDTLSAVELAWVVDKKLPAIRPTPNIPQIASYGRSLYAAYVDRSARTLRNERNVARREEFKAEDEMSRLKSELATKERDLIRMRDKLQRAESATPAPRLAVANGYRYPSADEIKRGDAALADSADLPDWR